MLMKAEGRALSFYGLQLKGEKANTTLHIEGVHVYRSIFFF